MSILKRSIAWVAVYLIVIIVIAQYDYQDYPIIDLARYFYFLAVVIVPVTVFIPRVRKLHVLVPMAFWAIVYAVIFFTMDRSATSGKSMWTVVVEIVLVETGAWLGYHLAYGISHAEFIMDAIALTTFPNRVQNLEDATMQIKIEVNRSRRYHRPFSLLVFQIDMNEYGTLKDIVFAIQHDIWNRFSFARLGQVIDEHIRQTDVIYRDRTNRFVILCPETDLANTQLLAARISKAVLQKTDQKLIWSIATFPDDAISFDDLLSKAISGLTHEAVGSNSQSSETSNIKAAIE